MKETVMHSKDLFGLVLRIVGLLGIILVVRQLDFVMEMGPPKATYLVVKALYLAIGIYLMRGAPMLVSFAYPGGSKA
jgi:uncharacterized membrane protein YczE